MTLRYADKPQLMNFGDTHGRTFSPEDKDPFSRFPANARPIASAPEQSTRPVVVYDSNGVGRHAIHHRGVWCAVESVRDPYTGRSSNKTTAPKSAFL